jgi:hypothetical protein
MKPQQAEKMVQIRQALRAFQGFKSATLVFRKEVFMDGSWNGVPRLPAFRLQDSF